MVPEAYSISQKTHAVCNFLLPAWEGTEVTFVAGATAASFFGAYLIIRRWQLRRHRRPLPPGPRGLPLLGNLPFLGPDLHRRFAELAGTYGPIMSVRLGPRLYAVATSPEAARAVLHDHDAVFANRDSPVAAGAITYGGLDIVRMPYGPAYRALRKVCVRELLSPARLAAVSALRRREVRRSVAGVRRAAARREAVDVGELAFLTSLNVMRSMLWGGGDVTMAEEEEEEGEEERRVGREFREVVRGITELLGAPNISDFVPVLAPLDLQGVERRMRGYAAWFDRVVDRIIDERRRSGCAGGGGDGKDFLQVMLELLERSDSELEEALTVDHMKAVFMDMILGGTDTVSTTVEWAMAEMMHNPEIMKKAQEELAAAVGGAAVVVEETHIPGLQYLDAVVKETLRLHPVVPLLIPHYPSETCEVNGYEIPRGTRVFVNVWAMHRDPRYWQEPLEFRPERFLAGGTKWDYRGANSNGFQFLPFGSGRRICVGISLAERMCMYILASLLHPFQWRLPEGTAEVGFSEMSGVVLKKAEPLVAVPLLRSSFSNAS